MTLTLTMMNDNVDDDDGEEDDDGDDGDDDDEDDLEIVYKSFRNPTEVPAKKNMKQETALRK